MYRFKLSCYTIFFIHRVISIHHMYRFKMFGLIAQKLRLYFNTSHVSVQDTAKNSEIMSFTLISIHHMYRFKVRRWESSLRYTDFNTSHVSVQDTAKNSEIMSFTLISIHHMYRFKIKTQITNMYQNHISIHHMYRFKEIYK